MVAAYPSGTRSLPASGWSSGRARSRRCRSADRRRRDSRSSMRTTYLIVVDKPAGVVVHPAKGHEAGTLAQALADRAAGGEAPYRAGIVHRLDRDTSGLLVVAKSDSAHRELKGLLQARELRREYLTLVDGIPPAHTGTIDAPIGRDRTRSRVALDRNRRARARPGHTSSSRAPASRSAAARLVGDRAHPPDPRAHDRRSAIRFSGTVPTAVRCGSDSSASSCTPHGSRFRIR